MVSAGDVCRLCLAMDARLVVLAGTPLQNIYEKLTEISFNTPHRPVVACHLCYSQLRKCHELMVRSVRADKVLTEILQSGEIAEQDFFAMIKQYHLDDGLGVTPTKLISITNIEDGLIKDDYKKEPQPTRSGGVMTTELIEFEESGAEGNTERGVPIDMEYMDSEEFINEENIKVEVLEEPLNVEGQELAGANVKLEVFEEMQDIAAEGLVDNIKQEQLEVVQHNEPEGAAPSNNYEKIQDTTTPTTQEQNILRIGKRITVLEEEIPSTSSATYMLWNAKNAANNRPAFKNIPMYVDIAINKNNSSVNSDNDCTSTETDVDNSSREHLKTVVISDECGDVLDDKCLLEERHNVTSTSNRTRGNGSSHQRTLLRKQRCGRIAIVNKHTDTRSKNLFECDVGQRFQSKGVFNDRINKHTGEKPFKCDICEMKFKQKPDLKVHLRIHTGEKPFECDICQMKFNQKSNLKVHLRTHTGEKPFECDICKSKFSRNDHLKVHLRTHTGEKPFECEICQVKCNEKASLKIHLRTHTGEKPFKCNICERKFIQKCYLKVHLRTHTGEKPFECNICKSKFSRSNYLKIHLRTHTGEKPFECKICKGKFTQKSNLKVHLRTHTDEKPFECNICKSKFREKRELKAHLRTHTGEKPFQCNICKSKFSQNGYLKVHLRTHTGEKPFECKICGSKFSQSGHLKVHLRTHTREKPF